MGENTKIEWADHTLNFWTGCEHVSPACAHCYAEAWAKRAGRDFAVRKLTGEQIRKLPFKWQAAAAEFHARHGRRQRVFVNSLSDFFDNKAPQSWRDSFFATARATPDVIYMLLTKRIGNAKRMLPADWGDGYENIWLGSTVIDQEEADRDIPKLLATPVRVRFLSCEPLLGPVDLQETCWNHVDEATALRFSRDVDKKTVALPTVFGIDWVIAGGESGGHARPSRIAWFRELRDQCAAAGVAFLFKQWGEWISASEESANVAEGRELPRMFPFPNCAEVAIRVGKKAAGRLLDGRTWDQFPQRERE